MKPAYVSGVGLWAPGFANVEAWLAGAPDANVTEPKPALIAPKLVRRTSFLTRMAADVLAQAQAGSDLGQVMTVYASANGEIRTLAALLEMLRGDGIYSPIRFQNSVHNTAAGHLSIATANANFTSSIGGGEESVAMGVLEAMTLLDDRGGEVIAVFADESPGDDFGLPPFAPLACALHLSATSCPSGLSLSGLRPSSAAQTKRAGHGLAENPCAAALHLLERIGRGEPGTVPLSFGARSWSVDLSLEGPSR